jgi:hypothetical protein
MKGIEVLPYNNGSVLVQSRREPEVYHIVDLSETPPTCTCEGYQFRCGEHPDYVCWHIRYMKQLLGLK